MYTYHTFAVRIMLKCFLTTTLTEHSRLTYDEAVQLFMKCRNHVESEDKITEAFRKFDEEGNGFIMVAELR